MAQSLFRVFDEDHRGKLTFFQFVQANNVRNLDTPEDKLGWMFDAFGMYIIFSLLVVFVFYGS